MTSVRLRALIALSVLHFLYYAWSLPLVVDFSRESIFSPTHVNFPSYSYPIFLFWFVLLPVSLGFTLFFGAGVFSPAYRAQMRRGIVASRIYHLVCGVSLVAVAIYATLTARGEGAGFIIVFTAQWALYGGVLYLIGILSARSKSNEVA